MKLINTYRYNGVKWIGFNYLNTGYYLNRGKMGMEAKGYTYLLHCMVKVKDEINTNQDI